VVRLLQRPAAAAPIAAGAIARAQLDNSQQGIGNAAQMGAGDAMHLDITVKSTDGNRLYFRVKKTTKLEKVIKAYCQQVGANVDNMRFLFDGVRVHGWQTPGLLDMEDYDEIDAMIQQQG
jgi:small ubiquitin-related modifier